MLILVKVTAEKLKPLKKWLNLVLQTWRQEKTSSSTSCSTQTDRQTDITWAPCHQPTGTAHAAATVRNHWLLLAAGRSLNAPQGNSRRGSVVFKDVVQFWTLLSDSCLKDAGVTATPGQLQDNEEEEEDEEEEQDDEEEEQDGKVKKKNWEETKRWENSDHDDDSLHDPCDPRVTSPKEKQTVTFTLTFTLTLRLEESIWGFRSGTIRTDHGFLNPEILSSMALLTHTPTHPHTHTHQHTHTHPHTQGASLLTDVSLWCWGKV